MKKYIQVVSLLFINYFFISTAFAQTKLTLGKQVFELHNVTGSSFDFREKMSLKSKEI